MSLLTPTNSTPAISKKEACEILNIAYNTTRLNKILTEYNEQKEYTAKRKKENRNKPFVDFEIAEVVTGYLRGDSITEIAKSIYRSAGSVKSLIERIGVPQRPASAEEKLGIDLIPDECRSEDFYPGEIVWSARHHQAVIVDKEMSIEYQHNKPGLTDLDYEEKYASKCYAILVLESINETSEQWMGGITTGSYQAFSLAYDLGKLSHLEKYGVQLSKLNS